MKLSIIILNYRSKELTTKCIETFYNSSGEKDYEIIIVDNGSGDNSVEVLHNRFPNIKIIPNIRNLGYGAGNNMGIVQAKGEKILILNPDVEIKYPSIEKMMEYLDSHPDVGLIGPKLIYPDGVTQDSYRHFPGLFDLIIKRTHLHRFSFFRKRMDNYLMYDMNNSETQEVDWLVGAAFMMPTDFFKKIGLFDERYFLFFEDTDLCRRVWKTGYKVIYFPSSNAIHNHKRLSQGKWHKVLRKKTFYIHIASAIKYFWKWK